MPRFYFPQTNESIEAKNIKEAQEKRRKKDRVRRRESANWAKAQSPVAKPSVKKTAPPKSKKSKKVKKVVQSPQATTPNK